MTQKNEPQLPSIDGRGTNANVIIGDRKHFFDNDPFAALLFARDAAHRGSHQVQIEIWPARSK